MQRTLFLVLTMAVAATGIAQTTPTAKKPTTTAHRATTATRSTAAKAAATANPADNPPNVPKVVGIPKNLYALRYVDVKVGTGELALPRHFYTVHYTGWLTDGTKFDSSYDHPGGAPFTFFGGAHQVITGWDTGFEGMRVGGKRRLYIPYQLAYGEFGHPPAIPAKSDLIFDVELISQSETPPTPSAAPAPPARPSTKLDRSVVPSQPASVSEASLFMSSS